MLKEKKQLSKISRDGNRSAICKCITCTCETYTMSYVNYVSVELGENQLIRAGAMTGTKISRVVLLTIYGARGGAEGLLRLLGFLGNVSVISTPHPYPCRPGTHSWCWIPLLPTFLVISCWIVLYNSSNSTFQRLWNHRNESLFNILILLSEEKDHSYLEWNWIVEK